MHSGSGFVSHVAHKVGLESNIAFPFTVDYLYYTMSLASEISQGKLM